MTEREWLEGLDPMTEHDRKTDDDTSPVVLNARVCGLDVYGAVYVGRPSVWGNPFTIGADGGRATVIEKYRAHLLSRPDLLARLGEIRGRSLICWCAPLACHADVLIEAANK